MANSVRVGVPSAWLPALGTLKIAGAAGLLLGLLGVRYIGITAAAGLVLFFLGAIGVHLHAREHRHIITTAGYFLLAAASLAASVAH
jgi:membrane-bound ClpP family serine protease